MSATGLNQCLTSQRDGSFVILLRARLRKLRVVMRDMIINVLNALGRDVVETVQSMQLHGRRSRSCVCSFTISIDQHVFGTAPGKAGES